MNMKKILVISILMIFVIGVCIGAANAASHTAGTKKYNVKLTQKEYDALTKYDVKYKIETKYKTVKNVKVPYKVKIPYKVRRKVFITKTIPNKYFKDGTKKYPVKITFSSYGEFQGEYNVKLGKGIVFAQIWTDYCPLTKFNVRIR